MTDKKTETKKVDPSADSTIAAVKRSLFRRFLWIIAIAFVLTVGLSIIWEKYLEPQLGFDLPAQEQSPAEALSFKPLLEEQMQQSGREKPIAHFTTQEASHIVASDIVAKDTIIEPTKIVLSPPTEDQSSWREEFETKIQGYLDKNDPQKFKNTLHTLALIELITAAQQGGLSLENLRKALKQDQQHKTLMTSLDAIDSLESAASLKAQFQLKATPKQEPSLWENFIHLEKDSDQNKVEQADILRALESHQWKRVLTLLAELPKDEQHTLKAWKDQIYAQLFLQRTRHMLYINLLKGL